MIENDINGAPPLTLAVTGAPPLTLAVTGATGFVGQAVLDHALAAGHSVRALARRLPPPPGMRMGRSLSWIEGTLETAAALDALCDGVDAVLHIAGAVNVPTREAFAVANIAGTAAVVDAARRAGVRRFIHVSSLAAREPGLSNYGWSKAEAETVVAQSGLEWTMIRPPGVYGPRDADMLEAFKMARRGVMLLPPPGRGSWIHVDDLAALLIAMPAATPATRHRLYEASDGAAGGVSHGALADLLGEALGKHVRFKVSAPAFALRLAAAIDRAVRGNDAKLTPDRARYMAHPDWVADPAKAPPPDIWLPHIALADGLAATARWYRDNGWL